jgi:integrase
VAKDESKVDAANSLEAIAREWYELHKHEWSDTYAERIITAMERDIFPWLGIRPINSIELRDLLGRLQQIQLRGAKETAHRLRRWLSPVFRYAMSEGHAIATRRPS